MGIQWNRAPLLLILASKCSRFCPFRVISASVLDLWAENMIIRFYVLSKKSLGVVCW